MNKTVLVTATNYSLLCKEGKRLLESNGFTIVENERGRPLAFEELREVVAQVDAVVAGVDTWNEDVFKLAPQLKIISRFGVGVDNIDLDAAKRYGIRVTNVPGGNANAVAELTVGLILSIMRNIPYLYETTRQGQWSRKVGVELEGCTVGLLGFGNIARMTARKLQGFDVNIIAYDKYPNRELAEQLGVQIVSLEEVLRNGDVVSMHLPSLPETYRLMSTKQFAMMKKTAYFINTARGALVDEAALRGALASEQIAGAAIDVYESEPVAADNPLFRLDNAVTTPHTAAETYETYRRVGLETAQAIVDAFSGRVPNNALV